MTERNMFSKFRDTFRKNPLDPSRRETVFAAYDEDRGYRAYHEHCQGLHASAREEGEDDALTQYGVEHIRALNETLASDLLKVIASKSQVSAHKEEIDYSEMLTVSESFFVERLFQNVFTPSLNDKLKRYFRSEYFIYWYAILLALPSAQARRSFLWHCDKGPSCHIKLLVYLNGSDEHGGNTEFLDRLTTDELVETGYLFGPVDARQQDLSALAKSINVKHEPKRWDMKPGDAMLFEPSQVLHCGILPTKGPRYVLAFCLLPSPIPCHEALKRTNGNNMSENYAWHANADDIRKALLESRANTSY